MSKALITPCITIRTTTCPSVIVPVRVSAASARDWTAAAACVQSSRQRRSRRSIHAPANGPMRKDTICPAKLTTPSSNAECVRRYTSHPAANRVIQVPSTETPWPMK